EECVRTLLRYRREGTIELVGTSGLQELKLHSQRLGRGLDVFYRERVARIGRVRQNRHTADRGDDLLEQFQLFAKYFHADAVGQPCDVPARAREARDESELNRIANARHDDRDRPGSVLGCHGWWRR